MDYQPPPFFKRGPSLQARLAIFSFASIIMMATDSHFQYLEVLRQGLSVALYPIQRVAVAPVEMTGKVTGFFVTHGKLQQENLELRRQQLVNDAELLQYKALQAENAYLRRLMAMREKLGQPSIVGEIFYAERDPFVHKLLIDRGAQHGVVAGSVILDDTGVVGQITRVLPLTSEVTLITDKGHAVPVQVLRNGLRAIVRGTGRDNLLELPFMPVNADVENGDILVTSGIDGTYPAGLPVAVVSRIERNAAYAFAKISCTPSAGVDRHLQLIILQGTPQVPKAEPAPPEEPEDPGRSVKGKR